MILANVGDSRAIVVNEFGVSRQVTIDHRPSFAEERQRVLDAGAKVKFAPNGQAKVYMSTSGDQQESCWHVTRALGDPIA